MRQKFEGQARKARVKRFPYAVVYWVDGGTLGLPGIFFPPALPPRKTPRRERYRAAA